MNSSVAVKPSDLSSHAVALADNSPASKRLPGTRELKMRLPLNAALTEQVAAHRRAVRAILEGEDSRLL
ncbi:phospho-2-dehydro-3-deoxyheptonate aldolase, partial [Pseudomonas amygdali pv. morsprunorum]